MAANNQAIHIGLKIETLLQQKNMTKAELGSRLHMSGSNARHLTKRGNLDVFLTQRIGNVLKYNFFKHFPIDEGNGTEVTELKKEKELSAAKDKMIAEKEKVIAALNAKIAEIEKQLSDLKSETEPVKMEMKYLKQGYEDMRQAHELLIASIRPTLRLSSGQARRKSLSSGERLMLGEGD